MFCNEYQILHNDESILLTWKDKVQKETFFFSSNVKLYDLAIEMMQVCKE